jgi:hypothetical protein
MRNDLKTKFDIYRSDRRLSEEAVGEDGPDKINNQLFFIFESCFTYTYYKASETEICT